MQQLAIHPVFRSKQSNREGSSHMRRQYSSPVLEEYQKMAEKYSSFLNNLGSKIDVICQKQKQRNQFKEQKLNLIKSQLLKKKHQLQQQYDLKTDPNNTENGKLFAEINSLGKLEQAYREIVLTLNSSIRKKEAEIGQLQNIVKEQQSVLKKNIKEQLTKQPQQLQLQLPRIGQSQEDSILSHSSSYSSKTRENFLIKLQNSWKQKISDSIDNQDDKLVVLKLLCVYARSRSGQASNINMQVINAIERQIKQKGEWLSQIKQLCAKQGDS